MAHYTNLPREKLLVEAQRAADQFPGCTIWFKFTCPACGVRCTLRVPNTLFENGICCMCGDDSPIKEGGFALEFTKTGESTLKDFVQ